MSKKIFYISILLVFLAPALILAHGDEKHKEKVEKVSTLMNEVTGHVHSDSLAQSEKNESMEKDFATIRENVSKSAVPTVIKAVSLAAIIAGLAFLYLPKKRKENSND